MKRGFLLLFSVVLGIFVSLALVSAFEFNGTVYDIDGVALENATVNMTARTTVGWLVVGYNTTTTNASGWFNMTVAENVSWMYEPVITKKDAAGTATHMGQSLPSFPSDMMEDISGTKFYLRNAGTFNITAVNSSGGRVSFRYQVKDTKLGYPVSEEYFNVSEDVVVNVPNNRNFSIMIFPDQGMPLSFDWDNFSSGTDYNFDGNDISSYNASAEIVHKQFNTTMGFSRVYGNITFGGISGWDEFTVVPFMLEPGAMVHANFGAMPHNMSGFLDTTTTTDLYNVSAGTFNISLPSTTEGSEMMLFATAKNNSKYYGAIMNLSLDYDTYTNGQPYNMDFVLYELLGDHANISMYTVDGAYTNITTVMQTISLINSSNDSLSNTFAHAETTVDYSSYGSKEFSWMTDIQQGATADLRIILLNVTGVKEINVFAGGGNYAPRRTDYTVDELQTPFNLTLTSFDPSDIDDPSAKSLVKISLVVSNSSCDVPNPDTNCYVDNDDDDGEGGEDGEGFSGFNPMRAIMGGGKLSFRMGMFDSGITVHYINVDMLASGPPDALFDDSASETTGDGFESAMRFGSGGPTIYDYILISMPYSEGAGSGLNDSAQVNASIPLLYDDDWNVVWNVTANGTDENALAGNFSHYDAKKADWAYLLSTSVCVTDQDNLNVSSPCFLDKTNNRIWLRLPHFSGTGPSISGTVLPAAASSSDSSSSSSSSGGTVSTSNKTWVVTFPYSSIELKDRDPLTRELLAKHRVKVKVEGENHHVGVVKVGSSTVDIEVTSDPQTATLEEEGSAKFDVTDDGYYDIEVTLNGINGLKANLTITGIYEEVPAQVAAPITGSAVAEAEAGTSVEESATSRSDKFGWIILIVIALAGSTVLYLKKFRKQSWKTLSKRVKIGMHSKSIKVG